MVLPETARRDPRRGEIPVMRISCPLLSDFPVAGARRSIILQYHISKESDQRMARVKSRAIAALGIICLILCLASGGVFVCRRLDYRESSKAYEKIREETVSTELDVTDSSVVDTDQLLAMNPDYAFWNEIPGTEISYPVVQTANNSDYLRKSFIGEYKVGGCIFIDAACPSDLSGRNTVIYGHRMHDGTMFSGLRDYLNSDYAAEHTELRIYLREEIRIYRLFSVRQTDQWDDYARTLFDSDKDYVAWMENQLSQSLYDPEPVSPDRANVVTLVTCAGDGTERLAVTWIQADIQ